MKHLDALIPLLLIPSLTLAFAACDAQVDDDFGGTPATGSAQSSDTWELPPPKPLVPVVFWSGDQLSAAELSYTGDLPVAFDFEILTPPQDARLSATSLEPPGSASEPAFALGAVFILDEDWQAWVARANDEDDWASEGFYGGCDDMMLLWLEDDIQPGTRLAQAFGTLAKGHHLLAIDHLTEDERAAWDKCMDDAYAPCQGQDDASACEPAAKACGTEAADYSVVGLDTPLQIRAADSWLGLRSIYIEL